MPVPTLQRHASQLHNASDIVKKLHGGPAVELNVGGTVFVTQPKTLIARSGFFKILAKSTGDMTMYSSYFIDRSPELFAQLLEVMRTGRLPQALDRVQWVSLRARFAFFCCSVVLKQRRGESEVIF